MERAASGTVSRPRMATSSSSSTPDQQLSVCTVNRISELTEGPAPVSRVRISPASRCVKLLVSRSDSSSVAAVIPTSPMPGTASVGMIDLPQSDGW